MRHPRARKVPSLSPAASLSFAARVSVSLAATLCLALSACGPEPEDLEPLDAPQNVRLTWEDAGDDFTQLRLTLTWNAVDGAEGYRVRIYLGESLPITSDLDEAPGADEVDLDVTGTVAIHEFLSSGERFAYRVGARRSDGRHFADAAISARRAPVVPDPALDACMQSALVSLRMARQALGESGDVTWSDLTRLECEGEGVATLDHLGVASGLERLQLEDNAIEELAPLSGLQALRVLWLGGNRITDLGPLSSLTSLESLYLDGNPGVTTLAPLTGLPALRSLGLGDHPSLPDLTELPLGLESLALAGDVPVTGFGHLSLSSLRIGPSARAAEVSTQEIGGLSGLTRLALYEVPLTDLEFMESLTALTFVTLASNGLTDITPLLSLAHLQIVLLTGNDEIPCVQLDDLEAYLAPDGGLVRPENCAP